jgi:hypothetical protein
MAGDYREMYMRGSGYGVGDSLLFRSSSGQFSCLRSAGIHSSLAG